MSHCGPLTAYFFMSKISLRICTPLLPLPLARRTWKLSSKSPYCFLLLGLLLAFAARVARAALDEGATAQQAGEGRRAERPPAAAHQDEEGRHQDRPDDERVQQYAESQREAELLHLGQGPGQQRRE